MLGTESGLVGYWPFNETAGTVVTDITDQVVSTITGATWGILDQERPGDETSLLELTILDPANTAWGGSKKIWVARRSGDRRTDTLFIQPDTAEVEGTDPYIASGATYSTPAGLTTNASGGTSDAIRWLAGAGADLSSNREEVGYFRFDISGANIPSGLFRVLARVSHEFLSGSGTDPVTGDFLWGLTAVFGSISDPIHALANDVVSTVGEDVWEILDLGSVVLPLSSIPDGFTPTTQEIRIIAIWDSAATVNMSTNDYVEWAVDHILLVPVEEGMVAADAIATADRLLLDGLSESIGVYETDSSDIVQKFAVRIGSPFESGPEPTRVILMKDDVGDPSSIELTVKPRVIHRRKGY